MKKKISKLILMGIAGIFLSGCSILPRVTFDRPNTVPQKTEKSEKREHCSGQVEYDSDGQILKCTKGYSLNEKFYNQQERKLTIKESILNFFANLKGWFFWIAIALVVFAPGSIGWIIGTVFNTSRYALESTVRAISRAKKNGGKYMEELDKEHAKNKDIKKTINSIRAKIDE
jgi:hypothetical protein